MKLLIIGLFLFSTKVIAEENSCFSFLKEKKAEIVKLSFDKEKKEKLKKIMTSIESEKSCQEEKELIMAFHNIVLKYKKAKEVEAVKAENEKTPMKKES